MSLSSSSSESVSAVIYLKAQTNREQSVCKRKHVASCSCQHVQLNFTGVDLKGKLNMQVVSITKTESPLCHQQDGTMVASTSTNKQLTCCQLQDDVLYPFNSLQMHLLLVRRKENTSAEEFFRSIQSCLNKHFSVFCQVLIIKDQFLLPVYTQMVQGLFT